MRLCLCNAALTRECAWVLHLLCLALSPQAPPLLRCPATRPPAHIEEAPASGGQALQWRATGVLCECPACAQNEGAASAPQKTGALWHAAVVAAEWLHAARLLNPPDGCWCHPFLPLDDAVETERDVQVLQQRACHSLCQVPGRSPPPRPPLSCLLILTLLLVLAMSAACHQHP